MANGNVPVAGPYPAVEFQPSEKSSSVYHTDQEYTDSSGSSHMYRAYNAQYNGTEWTTITPGGPSDAYATVQDADGSIHYYWNGGSSPWTEWVGSGNNAVYNAVDFGLTESDTVGTNNAQALQNAVNAAWLSTSGGLGGTVYIPPGKYTIKGPISLNYQEAPGNDHGIIIAGAGGDTELVQNDPANLFSFTGLNSGRGVRFRDLHMTFDFTGVLPPTLPAAVYVSKSQNITCERVFFLNWPQSIYLDNEALQCGLFDCTIEYDSGVAAQPVMIYLGGSENYVDNCVIRQKEISTGGPTGCTGIVVEPAGGAIYITNCHISYFTTGIWVLGGGSNLTHLYCSNLFCESWTTSLLIQPISGGTIYQVFCDDCAFSKETASTDSTATGVIIDTNGGENSNVSDIFLNNCMCYHWNGPGVKINAGQSIVITGGRYGSNAIAQGMTTSGGIAITGTAANVTISGADLSGLVTSPSPGYATQPYALSITAVVGGLYVRGCNLTGNTSGPLYTSGAGTQIEITDCAGYNDLGTVLQNTIPPPTNPISNTSRWTNAPNGWFGPIAFYVQGAGNVTIDGNNTHLTDGGYTLSPGETASIAGTAAHFLAIGK